MRKRKQGYQYVVSITIDGKTTSRRSDKFFERSEIPRARDEAFKRCLSTINADVFGGEYDADEGAAVIMMSKAKIKEGVVYYARA